MNLRQIIKEELQKILNERTVSLGDVQLKSKFTNSLAILNTLHRQLTTSGNLDVEKFDGAVEKLVLMRMKMNSLKEDTERKDTKIESMFNKIVKYLTNHKIVDEIDRYDAIIQYLDFYGIVLDDTDEKELVKLINKKYNLDIEDLK